MPHRVTKPRAHSARAPRSRIYQDVWNLQREVALLTTQVASELQALDTWVRRLEQRTAYEETHGGASQIPALRQATASCQCRVLDLERRLLDAQVRLRYLRNQEGGKVQPWSALK